MKSNRTANAHLGMLLWAAIVGLSFPVVTLMSEGLPPLFLTSIRFAFAALVLLPMLDHEGRRVPPPRALALYGVMGLCLAGFFGAMFWAAHRTTPLSMSALFVTVPFFAYAAGRMVGVEKAATGMPALLGLGAAGALIIALSEPGAETNVRFGSADLVFLGGCVATALYPVVSKLGLVRGTLSPSAAVRTFWSLVAGSLLIGAAALVLESPAGLASMTVADMALLAYLGAVSSGGTFWLMQRATAVLTPSSVTAYGYLVPFVSLVIVAVTDPGRIGWTALAGSLLVIVTMVLLLRRDASG